MLASKHSKFAKNNADRSSLVQITNDLMEEICSLLEKGGHEGTT